LVTVEVLQVAIVCAGYESSFRSVTLVKSLLYHRRHAITMHFLMNIRITFVNLLYDIIVNRVERKFASCLYFTGLLCISVNVLFYNSSLFINRVSWIPNRHYSREYGLLKLTLTDIFPENLKKLSAFDGIADVKTPWSVFSFENFLPDLKVLLSDEPFPSCFIHR
uniref:Uncharacterized protein n=1 Tax=Parascaris equorum TaxID=6256 RepID=A0A914RNQ0_PAREQ